MKSVFEFMSVSLSRWRRDTCVGELPVRVGKHRHTVRVVLDKVLGSHRGGVRRFVLTHVLTLDHRPCSRSATRSTGVSRSNSCATTRRCTKRLVSARALAYNPKTGNPIVVETDVDKLGYL